MKQKTKKFEFIKSFGALALLALIVTFTSNNTGASDGTLLPSAVENPVVTKYSLLFSSELAPQASVAFGDFGEWFKNPLDNTPAIELPLPNRDNFTIAAPEAEEDPLSKLKSEDEVVEMRNATTKQYRNPDGSITAVIAAGPVHYREDGEWKDVILDIEQNTTGRHSDYAYASIKNDPMRFYSASSGKQGLLIDFGKEVFKDWINPEMRWLDDKGNILKSIQPEVVEGYVDSNRMTYPSVYKNTDVSFKQGSSIARTMDIVLNDRSALAEIPEGAVELAYCEQLIMPKGWSYQTITDPEKPKDIKEITLSNSENKPTVQFYAPDIYEKNNPNNTIFGRYSLTEEGDAISICKMAPIEWLTAPERQFPIVVDPTLGATGTNYTGTVSSAGDKWPGDADVGCWGSCTPTRRAYAHFDLSGIIEGANFSAAALYTYIRQLPAANMSHYSYVGTYNATSATGAQIYADISYSSGGSDTVNTTDTVGHALITTFTATGYGYLEARLPNNYVSMVIRSATTTSYYRVHRYDDASYYPRLTVTYSAPTVTASLSDTQVTAGNSVIVTGSHDAGTGTCYAYWDTDTTYGGGTTLLDLESDCYGAITVPNSTDGLRYICTRPVDANSIVGYGCGSLWYDESPATTPTIACGSYTTNVWRNDVAPTCTWNVSGGPTTVSGYYCVTSGCTPTTYDSDGSYPTTFGEGTNYFRARNWDTGGYSGIAEFIVKMDTSAPSTPSMIAEPTYTPYTENTVYTSGSTDGGVGGIQYNFCRNFTNTTTGCTASGWTSNTWYTFASLSHGQIYYYFVQAKDALGNTTGWSSSTFSTQDSIQPAVSVPTIYSGTQYNNMWFKGTIWLRSAISDSGSGLASGTCAVSINSGGWDSTGVTQDANYCYYNGPTGTGYTPNANFDIQFRVMDVAGNWGGHLRQYYYYDATNPYLSSQTGFDPVNWYTSNQTSYFYYTDAGVGISSGSPANCVISTNGISTSCSVTPNVCDYLSNCNTTQVTSATIKLDTVHPTLTFNGISESSDYIYVGGSAIFYNNAVPSGQSFTMDYNLTDNLSGALAGAYYVAGESAFGTTPTAGTPFDITYTIDNAETCDGALTTVGYDYAMNDSNPDGYACTLDTTAPTTLNSILINSGATYTTSATVTLTLSSTDAGAGLSQMQFSCDNSNWTTPETYSGSKSFNITNQSGAGCSTAQGSKTVYVKFRDNVNNWSATASDSITYDTTNPVVSANNSSTSWYNTSPTITLSTSDSGGAGLSYSKYSWDTSDATCRSSGTSFTNGNTITIPSQGSHTLYLCNADNAGNTGSWNGPYKLDSVNPTGSISIANNYYNPSTYSTTTTITGTAGDALSGLSSVYVYVQRTSDNYWWNPTTPGWQAAPVNNAVNGTTSWYYSGLPLAQLQNGVEYKFTVAIQDNAGNSYSPALDSFIYDSSLPTVTINQAGGQADPTNASPINFTVVFSEAVTGFSSVNLSGTAGANTVLVTGSGTTYTATVSGMSVTGTVIASIAAGVATDAAGNGNSASTSTDNTVTYDITPPGSFSITGPPNPTNDANVTITWTASTGATSYDVSIDDSSGGCPSPVGGQIGVTGTSWNIGDVILSEGVTYYVCLTAKDAANNSTAASNSGTYIFVIDATPPSVTINQAGGQNDPTNTSPINFTVVFSEAVTGFSSVNLSGSAGANTVLVTGSGTTYTATVSGMSVTGTVIASIAAGVATDAAGNGNSASTSTDNTVTYDITPPGSFSITGPTSPTNDTTPNITWGASSGASTYDVKVDDTSGACPSPVASTTNVAGTSWTVSPALSNGVTYYVCVTAKDTATNTTLATNNGTYSFLVDTTAPTVTINQAGGQTDPTNASPINFTVVFSESTTNFATGDVTLGGTAGATTGTVTGSGTTYNVAVSGMTGTGTVIPAIAAGVATDTAGNGNSASTSTDNSVTYDITPPGAFSITGPTSPTNDTTPNITWGASTGASTYDVKVDDTSGACPSPVASTTNVAGTSWTVSPALSNAVTYYVCVTAKDTATNTTLATNNGTYSFLVDTVGPTVTINQAPSQNDPTNVSPILFEVFFSESITGFTSGDVTLSGTAGATTAVITPIDGGYSVAVSGMTGSGTVIASIGAGVVTDTAGNGNSASTSTDNTVTYDITPPGSFSITGPTSPTNDTTPNITWGASTGASTYDVKVDDTSGACPSPVASTTNVAGTSWTVSPALSNGTTYYVCVTAKDTATNTTLATNNGTYSFLVDTTPPTVTINQAGGQADPTNASPINFTVVFSESVTGFATGDVTLGGTAGATTGTVTGSGTTYNVAVSGMTVTGTVVPTIGAGIATDAASNGNSASTSTDNTVTYDITPPGAFSITGPTSPTNDTTPNITWGASSGAATYDVKVDDTSGACPSPVASTTDVAGTSWTVSPALSNGITYYVCVTAKDAATNTTLATNNGTYSFLVDTTPPTVTINQAGGQTDPTNASPINFTVVFSESTTNFATGDVTLGGTAGATTGTVTGSGTTYNVAVSGMTGTGTVIPTLAAGVATDTAGNGNSASTSTDNTVTYDATAPVISNLSDNGATNVKSGATVSITFDLVETGSGMTTNPTVSITQSNDTAIGTAVYSTRTGTGNPYSYTYTYTVPAGNYTNVKIKVNAVDNASNNATQAVLSPAFNIDNTAPTVTINQAGGQSDPTNASPINFAVIFSESVTGFATGDVTLSGTAGATTGTVTGSGTTYNVAVSGMTGDGTVIATIGASKAVDVANNNNSASTSTDNTVTYDITAPTINSITSVAGDTTAPYYDTTNNASTVIIFTSSDATTSVSACKWDSVDTTYALMANSCSSTTQCTSTLTGEGAKTAYIRCIDTTGNAMSSSQAVGYTVNATPPTASCSVSEGTNPGYQYQTGTTLYYNSGYTGGFTVDVTASDPISGIESVTFPALGTGFSPAGNTDTSSPYSLTYSWTTAATTPPDYQEATVLSNSGLPNTCDFTVLRDVTAPTGTITYSTQYITNLATDPSMTIGSVTESGSGENTSSRTLQVAVGTLSDGSCSGYGSYTTVAGFTGAYPTVVDSVTTLVQGNCYKYQWQVADNVGNVGTFTGANEFKVDTTIPDTSVTDVTESSSNIYFESGTTTVFYKTPASSQNFTVEASANDPQSGIQYVTFPGISASITPSTSQNDTSSPYSNPYTITTSANTSYPTNTVTGLNNAGLTQTDNFAVTVDNAAPTGASVTCPGAYDTDGNFNVTGDQGSDTGSDVDTSAGKFQRRDGTLSGDSCSGYTGYSDEGTGTNLEQLGLTTGCYEYQYITYDLVGNSATSSSCTVKVDTTPPSVSITSVTESSNYIYDNGSTLYYKNNVATPGSFILNVSATDNDTGIASVSGDADVGEIDFGDIPSDTAAPYLLTYTIEQNATCTSPITVTATSNASDTNTVDRTCTLDTTAPTIASLSDNGATSVKSGATVSITFNLTETGSGQTTNPTVTITQSNDTVIGTAAYSTRTGTGNPYAYTYTYTVPAGNYSGVKVKVDANDNVTNAATQAVLTSAFNIDNTGPTVTINQAGGQADPTNASPINYTVIFSESVTGFATGDVTLGGTAGATTGTVTGSGTTYNVAVTGMTVTGTVTAEVGAGVAIDTAGNGNSASTSTDNSVTYDITPPGAFSISGPTDPINDTTPNITWGTSSGAATYDVKVDDTSGACPSPVASTTDVADTSWTVSPALSNGTTYYVCVTAKDTATNTTLATNNGTYSFLVDTTPPTVTINQAGGQSDPTNASPINFTVVFSESTTNFATGDVTLGGTAGATTGTVTGSGTTYNVAVSGMTGTGTVIPTIGAGVATDAANNSNSASTSTDNTVTYDITPPGAFSITGPTSPTNDTTPNITWGSSTGASTYDVKVDDTSGACPSPVASTTDVAGTSWTVSPALSNGMTYYVCVTAKDTATNTTLATNNGTYSFLVDTTAPTVTINQAGGQTDPTNASPINFTVVFSESTTNFATGDVTLGGTAGATTGTVTGSGTTYNVAVTGMTGFGTVIPTIGAGVATDSAGNGNSASTSTDNTVTYDATAPVISNLSDNGATNVKSGATVSITFDLVETGSGITTNPTVSITQSNDTAIGTATYSNRTGTGNPYSYTYTYTVPAGNYTNVKIKVNAVDNAGNNATQVVLSPAFNIDNTAPTVTINQEAGQDDPTNISPINFTVVFSESVTNFATGDVTLGGTAGATTGTVTGSGTTYNVAVTGMTVTGTVVPTIGAGVATDAASNSNSASTSTDNTVTYDITPPGAFSITGPTSPTNDTTPNITWGTSTGASTYDVKVDDTSGPCPSPVASTTDVVGTSWTVSPALSNGTTYYVCVTAKDTATNTTLATNNGTYSFLVDTTAPTVTINQAGGQADPTNASPINFTVVFSESTTNFATGDVTLAGTAGATTGTVTGSGTTYNVAVSGMTGSGTVIPTIGAGVATDAAGNGNSASTSTDNTVTYDITPPGAFSITGPTSPTNDTTPNITWGASSGASTYDVKVDDTSGACPSPVASTTDVAGTSWTVSPALSNGTTYYVCVTAKDTATNTTLATNNGTYSFLVDTTPPTVTINQAGGQSDPTNASPINFTVVFSESVTGFATGDVTLTGTAAATTGTVTGSGTTYNVAVSGMTGDGTVIATIASSRATDAAGNGNSASTSTDNTVTYDTDPPGAFSITGPTSPTNDTTPNITWGASTDASTYDVKVDDTSGACPSPVASTTNVAGTSWTVSPALSNGTTYYVCVTAKDTATNTTLATNNGTYSFTVDTTAPTVTINQEAGQDDPTNASPINFTVVFSESTTNFATGDVTMGGTAGATTGTVTGSGTTYNVAVSGMTGTGTVIPTIGAGVATDTAGNGNSASTSTDNNVTYDITPPTITTVTEDDTDNYVTFGTLVNLTSDGADATSGIATCNAWWDNDNVSYDGDETDLGDLGSTCDGEVETPDSTDGTWYYCVRPEDNVGLTNYECTNAITYDETGPTGTITNASGNPTNDDTPTLNLTISDSGVGVSGAQMRFSCNNTNWSSWETYAATKSNFDIKPAVITYGCPTTDGTRTVYVQFRDSLLNEGSSASTTSFILDTTAPTAPTLTCTNYTHDTWQATNPSTTCTITDTATPSARTATAYSTNGGSNWTDNSNLLAFTFTPTANATTNVIMRISDTGGGPTNSNTYIIKVDTLGPTGSITNASGNPTNDDTPTLNLTIADAGIGTTGAQMRFSCNNTDWTNWEAYATPKNTFDIKPDIAAYGCGTTDGSRTVYVQYRDSLTNIGSSYNTGAFTLDTTSLVISATAPTTGSYINAPVVSYTYSEAASSGSIVFTRTGGTTDNDSPHTCTLQGTALTTGAHTNLTLAQGANACSQVWTALVNGTVYTVTFNASDLATNPATAVNNTSVTYDTAGPTGTITNASGNPTNDDTPTLNLTIADTGVGTTGAQMRFSCNNSTWTAWEAYSTPKTNFDIKPAATAYGCATTDGTRTVYVQYRDSLLNEGTSASTTAFVLDTTAPPAPTLTCTNYTHDTWQATNPSTTCTITDTATPSTRTATAYSTNGGANWTDNTNLLSFTFTPTASAITEVLMQISDTGGGPTDSNTYIIKSDSTAPTDGSVNNTDGYENDTTITVVVDPGTDLLSGLSTTDSDYYLEYRSIGLIGGVCGTFIDNWANANVTENDTAISYNFTATNSNCYQFRYTVKDTVGNTATFTGTDTTMVSTQAPSATCTLTEGTNPAYQYISATTIFYNSTYTGAFNLEVDTSDTTAGIDYVNFPTLATGFTPTTTNDNSDPYDQTYNWTTSATTSPGAKQATSYSNSGLTTPCNFTVTRDVTTPSTGSISYSTQYLTSTGSKAALTVSDGTDVGGAGVNTSTRVLQRATAALDNFDGTCDTFGAYSATTYTGTYPNIQDAGTVTDATCYKYRWLVSDNVGNQATYTSASEVKYDSTQPTAPTPSVSESSNNIYYASGAQTLYYKTPASNQNFNMEASPEDPQSGIQKVTFPGITDTGFSPTTNTDDASSPYAVTYTIGTSAVASPGSKTLTATNNALLTNTDNIIVNADNAAPTGASVTCPGTYDTDGDFNITGTSGTDSGSGINESASYFQRKDGTLSNDSCDYGANNFTSVGTANAVNLSQTGLTNGCYEYRYYTVDMVSNNTTSTSCAVKVDTTIPTVSITSISESSNYIYDNGSTLYFTNVPATPGSFTVNVSADDTDTYITSVSGSTEFGDSPTDLDGEPYELIYSIENGSNCTTPLTVTAESATGLTNNTTRTCTLDTADPTTGSTTYADTYQNTTTIDVYVDRGTDALSGMSGNNADYYLEYNEAPLAGGSCGSYTGWTDAGVSETASANQYSFTGTAGKCYQFRYSVRDNVYNPATFTGTDTVGIDTDLPIISSITSVAGDTSAPYYDTTDNSSTSIVFVSSDTTTTVDACKWDTSDVAYASMTGLCLSPTNCVTDLSGDGLKTVYLRCIDDTGNAMTSSQEVSYTIYSTPPAVTDPNLSIAGGTGTAGAYKVGDTVTVTWDNSINGDDNTDLTVNPTANLSGWGGSATAAMTDTTACGGTAADDIWEACFTLISETLDNTNVNTSVTATNMAGPTTGNDTTNATVDNQPPDITANGTLTITTDNGVVGVAALNNGTSNQDKVTQSAVTLAAPDTDTTTINLTALTGQAALTAATQSGSVISGALDNATQTFTITVTDNAGNADTIVSDAISVDNVPPTVTTSAVSVTGATGTGGIFITGDTATGRWNDSAAGDNNSDTITSVIFNLTDWISTAGSLSGTNNSDIWTTAEQSPLDSQSTTNNNVIVTATDNAGNTTTTEGTNNYTIESLATDPDNSSFTATPTSVMADGISTSLLTATLRDALSDPVAGATVSVDVIGASVRPINCTTADVGTVTKGRSNSSGQACFLAVSSTMADDVEFTATDTSNSIIITQKAYVSYTNCLTDRSASTFAASKAQVETDGLDSADLDLHLIDACGFDVDKTNVATLDDNSATSVTYTPPGSTAPQTYSTAGGGLLTTAISSITSGLFTFDASLNEKQNDTTVYTENPGLPNEYNGSGSLIVGSANQDDTQVSFNMPFDFSIYAQTVTAGNPVYLCTNGFLSLNSGSCPASGALTDAIAGYHMDLTTNGGGIYQRTTANSITFVFDAQTKSAEDVNFEIKLYNNNRIEIHYEDAITAASPFIGLYNNSSVADASSLVAPRTNKATKFEYSSPITAFELDSHPEVEFLAGDVNVENSTVVADPSVVTADGNSYSIVTVTVRDVNMNPITGRDIQLDQDGAAEITQVDCGDLTTPAPLEPTDISGEACFQATNEIAQLVTFTATDITDLPIILGSDTVDFGCVTGPGQQCVQVSLEAGTGSITMTAPSDFSFLPVSSGVFEQEQFTCDDATLCPDNLTGYNLNVDDLLTVIDTRNSGGFTVQLQAATPFETADNIFLPFQNFYAATTPATTGGTKIGGIEYDLNYSGITCAGAPLNTAGSLLSAGSFLYNFGTGNTIPSTIHDLMQCEVNQGQGRNTTMNQNINYHLLLPALQPPGLYQVTLTFDLVI